MANLLQKTIIEIDTKELDEKVNAFCQNKNIYVAASQSYYAQPYHVRIIFYKEIN